MSHLWYPNLFIIISLIYAVESLTDKIEHVKVGDSVKLECTVQTDIALKETKFQWFLRQELFANSQKITISDVQLSDAGIYRCKSQSTTIDGKIIDQEESTELIVGDKSSGSSQEGGSLLPKIQMNGQNQSNALTILETMKLPLTCKVFTSEPSSVYTIQWTRPDNSKVNSSVLFIDMVTKDQDEGTYTCVVTHKNGNTNSATLSVSIEKLPLRIRPLSNELLESGGLISRECFVNVPVTKLVEDFDYVWFKDGIVISNGNPLELPIQDAKEQSGQYKCLAQGRTTKAQMETTVDVQIDDETERQFSLVLTQDPPEASIGNEVKFKAEVTPSLDDPTYSWQFKNNVVSQTEVYVLKSFQERNRGLYTCNVVGYDKTSKTTVRLQTAIDAKVSGKVDVNLLFDGVTFTVLEGSQQELHCKIEDKNVKPQWSYSSEVLDDEGLRNMSIDRIDRGDVSILSFRTVKKSHEGSYKCMVGNKLLSAFMKVIQTEVSLSVIPSVINSTAGEPAEFHCQITSSQNEVKNTDLKWWFEVDDNSVRQLDMTRWTRRDNADSPQNSFISLKDVRFSDKGNYFCVAPAGQKATGELIVNRPTGRASLEVIMTPRVIRVRSHQNVQMDCLTNMDYQPYGRPTIAYKNGTALGSEFKIDKTKEGRTRIIVADGFSIHQNGTIIKCMIDGQSAEAVVLVELDGCHPGQKICRDGSKCIEMALFCNGQVDCRDSSDEDSSYCAQCDPINKQCKSVGGKLPENPYYQAQWRCDGEDDCGNGFDEQDCSDSGPIGCNGQFYSCRHENKKIPQAFLCDLEADCAQGDDEQNCTVAEIFDSTSTKYSFELKRGSGITINCTAKGYPLPKIIWRANWGCLPRDGRIKVITETKSDCRTVVSSLTISGFQPGDDGVYNCEALTSRSRALSKDFSLRLG